MFLREKHGSALYEFFEGHTIFNGVYIHSYHPLHHGEHAGVWLVQTIFLILVGEPLKIQFFVLDAMEIWREQLYKNLMQFSQGGTIKIDVGVLLDLVK